MHSPEVQGCELAFYISFSLQFPELYHLMVTAAEDAFDLHIATEPLLVGKCEVQQNTSYWLLYHLEEEVVINAFQEPPGFLVSCYVVAPADIGVVEVSHED